MVWLAAGGSTAILGYLLYRYLSVPVSPSEAKITVGNEDSTKRPAAGDDAPPSFNFEGSIVKPADRMSYQAEYKDKKDSLSNGTTTSRPAEKYGRPKPPQIPTSQPSAMTAPSVRSLSPPRLKPQVFSNMSAPPRPGSSALRPPPSAAASLRVPATKVLSNTSMAPTSSIMPQNGKPSRKVILQPGHSPLDWAMLTKDPNGKLRGTDLPDHLIRVTPSLLKYYNGRKGRDAWSVYQGKVYNITPYLPFHPGGEGELMRGAGKDAGQLFMEVHPWVNWENMLSECTVGILVGEGEEKYQENGGLDEMD